MERWRERFSVRIAGEDLSFSAAHFLASSPEVGEPLHGHDYQVAVEVGGVLGAEHYVSDFIALRSALRQLLEQWNHRVLLPDGSGAVHVVRGAAGEIEVRLGKRRWVFPQQDCRILPVPSTTAELLARTLGRELIERLARAGHQEIASLRVELKESPGCIAVWQQDL